MNIYAERGTKVRFIGGHMSDKLPHPFVLGNIYTVESTCIHSWYTDVKIEGVEGRYNSAWFQDVLEES